MAFEQNHKPSLDEAKDNTRVEIEQLINIAKKLSLKKILASLNTTNKQLEKESFVVIIIGPFSTGKTTFLNALLGRPLGDIQQLPANQPLLPMGKLPTTPILTIVKKVKPGEVPKVQARDFDGNYTDWDFNCYREKVKINHKETQTDEEFFKSIREFEVSYPCALTTADVVYIDAPGISDTPERTAITKAAFDRCDAAIALFKSDFLADQQSRELFQQAQENGLRIFWVVNLFNDDQPGGDGFSIAALWNRLIKQVLGKSEYAGQSLQDFTDYNVYFVHAQKALEGRFSNNKELLEASGIRFFEKCLNDFLQRERLSAHIQRHIKAADNQAEALLQEINSAKQKILTAQRSKSDLRNELESKLNRLKDSERVLDDIIGRNQRDIMEATDSSINNILNEMDKEIDKRIVSRA